MMNELKNPSLNKKNRQILSDGSIYEGQVNSKNQPHGRGKITYLDNSTYEGSMVYGEANGAGILKTEHATYTGDFVGGKPHGNITILYHDTEITYIGSIAGGVKNGDSLLMFKDGGLIRAVWHNGETDHHTMNIQMPTPLALAFFDSIKIEKKIQRHLENKQQEKEEAIA